MESHPDSQPRRTKRKPLSCAPCRRRKLKCSRGKPCDQCVRCSSSEPCDYDVPPPTPPRPPRPLPAVSPSSPLSAVKPSASTHRTVPLQPGQSPLGMSHEWLTWTRRNAAETSASALALALASASPSASLSAYHALSPIPQRQNLFSFRGKQQRTRFFGRSHWATTVQMFPELIDHVHDYQQVKGKPSVSHFQEYISLKSYKRDRRPTTKHCLQGLAGRFVDMLPGRPLADYLVSLFLSTYEMALRVVHVPSFQLEWTAFWDTRSVQSDQCWATEILLVKALTMMAAASCLVDDTSLEGLGSDRASLSQLGHDWVHATRLHLDVIQAIACDGDLVGATGGLLVREAMMMGLHRDPAHFPSMTPFWAETRKRLWWTVLELELQTSLHLGVPLTLSWEDFDCPRPLNVEDEDFAYDSTALPILLVQSLPVRMKIARLVNRVRFTVDADKVKQLSDSLATSLTEILPQPGDNSADDETSISTRSCAGFQKSFYLFLMWRSMLALHRSVLVSLVDAQNEIFFTSRKYCVQTSVALLEQLQCLPGLHLNLPPGQVGHGPPHVLRLQGGLFQDDIFHAAVTVCFELRLQLRDSKALLPTGPISRFFSQSALCHRMALLESIEHALKYFEYKVRREARACKIFTILCILYLSIESQFASIAPSLMDGGAGCAPRKALTIDEACPLASRRCLNLLLERDAGLVPVEIPPAGAPLDGGGVIDVPSMDLGHASLVSRSYQSKITSRLLY
ncbi:hypothetical protein BDW74DRAFT_185729 [Aspergillus multicolor]|uniref:uncharacterized protein n=1 Tax=Aspergillus multicolor TaxID=41759 RepID=UPI003CCDA4AB